MLYPPLTLFSHEFRVIARPMRITRPSPEGTTETYATASQHPARRCLHFTITCKVQLIIESLISMPQMLSQQLTFCTIGFAILEAHQIGTVPEVSSTLWST
ncbi:hypothetical protein CSKR_103165 [Clonorchis sinensis]|uniref:Uncharacterized protein n=1 Tax=Clonorchis sinensis TaxID=79923 RepID=A0A3R7FC18_CLOSI|nr:hypothetical protein CSKR_103165 [Clonorchis sinensis]